MANDEASKTVMKLVVELSFQDMYVGFILHKVGVTNLE